MTQSDFHNFVINDLLINEKGILSRAMFGGFGLYKFGVIFGMIVSDQLYFKVDKDNLEDYEKHDCKPFTYIHGSKSVKMSYYEVPEEIWENKDELKVWIDKAVAASMKAKKK